MNAEFLDDIPESMKAARRWLVWKSIPQAGKKPSKVPFYPSGIPRNGATDTPDDMAQLGTFEAGLRALVSGNYAGLGFALGPDGTGKHWQGVDLDAVSKRPELAELVADLPGYTETSPSGDGWHAIGYGVDFPSLGSNGSGIEAYSHGRFFTVTGENAGIGKPCDLSGFVARVLVPKHKPASTPEAAQAGAEAAFVPAETLRDLRSALNALRADDRGQWVKIGHALKTIGDHGRALWLEWSQTSELYDPADAAQKWETFKPSATSYQAVFAEAQRAGWLNPMSNEGRPSPTVAAPDGIDLAPITLDELHRAQLTPRVILENLLYSDVRTRIAAGGTGKTTVALYEAAMLALGRELWGRIPDRPMRTVIVTREDGREILVARLREICYSAQLSTDELNQVLGNVLILDLSSVPFRLSRVVEDVVYPHSENIDQLTSKLQAWAPDWIIFDPLVSFGVGESRVNDAEQGLIEAFRILRNRLDCCVEGIHHSGKANAREKSLDQYAGRGGSALSDGCRMVAVMQPLNADEWREATGGTLEPGESALVMALPKMSYSRQQPPIFIRRTGYRFTMETPTKRTPEQQAEAITNQVEQFIRYEYEHGRRYSTADLEHSRDKIGLSRDEVRKAITALKVEGRVVYHHVNGKPGSHYQPVTVAEANGDGIDEISETHKIENEPSRADHRRGPIGKEDGGDGAARPSPCFPDLRGNTSATVRDARDGMKWELPEGAEIEDDKAYVDAMMAVPLPPSAQAGLHNLGALLTKGVSDD